jgi:hypothetical protein
MGRISTEIRMLAETAAPEPPSRDIGLPIYSKLLRKFMREPGDIGPPPPPPGGGEPISFKYINRPDIHLLDDGQIKLSCSFRLELRDDLDGVPERVEVRVSPKLSILEDEGTGRTHWPADLTPDRLAGFKRDEEGSVSGSWTGTLERAVPVDFEVCSHPYSSEWTAAVSPEVLVLDDDLKRGGNENG